jgi:hypothetical protein
VLRGLKGVGKGILGNALIKVLGQHGMYISNHKHLTGQFNGHLLDCVFLFADEAFFAGDRQGISVLKSVITDPLLPIEAKHVNLILVQNMLHILMASNEDWVVPASTDERRFFVLDVSDAHKQDHAYFGAIKAQLKDGGYAAMLRELQARDISKFEVRAVPKTKALQFQQEQSLDTKWDWWLQVLTRGYVFVSQLGLESSFNEWQPTVSTELLYASYMAHAKERREYRPMNRMTFGRFLKNNLKAPTSRPNEHVAVGEHWATEETVEETPDGHKTRRKVRFPAIQQQWRPYCYEWGNLEQARAKFVEITKIEVEWPEVEEPVL